MSDCFDHAGDAADDLCFGRTFDEGCGDYSIRRDDSYRTCKVCMTPRLKWRKLGDRWLLYKDGAPHDCRPKEYNF